MSEGNVVNATWTLPEEALCGAHAVEACEGRGRLQPDPYESDVNNRKVLRYLCEPCADEIAAGI